MSKSILATNLLKDLNPEQKEAVTHSEGPLLIVAGAGTGKTTVITRRIAWLIEQGKARPEEILALTFTDKASGEMEERVDRLLPTGYVNILVSTFHSFGERVLKDWGLEIGLPTNFRLLTSTEQWMIIRNNLDKFNLDYYRPLGNPTKFIHALLQHFSRAKDEEVYPEDYLKFAESQKLNTGQAEFLKKGKRKSKSKVKNVELVNIDESEGLRLNEVAQAYGVYQKLLLDSSCLDFGDLINYTVKLLRSRPRVLEHFKKQFKYILVDEFQDTNYAQYELIKLLGGENSNITVVGDDDQSIYKFRGASISNILEFKQDYPRAREIFLTTNYRSYQNILDTAYEFIQLNNPYRLEVKLATEGKSLSKKLQADRKGKGEISYFSFAAAGDEAEGVVKKIIELQKKQSASWSDFAILVRANSSAPIFLQVLKQYEIPFDYVASRGLYSESIILDIMAYLKLLDNYHESEALYRVLNMEPFQMSVDDLAKLLYQANKKTISLYESLKQSRLINLSDGGIKIVDNLLALLDKHTSLAREHLSAEVYVHVVEDLGINERVAHPALVREAQYLTSFYERIQRFELDSINKSLNNFLQYLKMEQESGEEGELPQNYEEGPETVKVITVHSAKGLEWPYVFIVQLVDRRFPSTERREPIELPQALIKEILPEGDVHLQEERRLFYVGLTRAKNGLFLTRAEDYFGKTVRKPSRFLYELGYVSEDEYSSPAAKLKSPSPAVIAKQITHYPVPETFSFSSVSAWRKCPLEFKYRYLLKLPTPGAAALSFGSTMHKALEQYLRAWQQRLASEQVGLFANTKKTLPKLPSEQELKDFFTAAWIDDWYESKKQKEEYRTKRGPQQLKNFYTEISAHPPKPKYLEQFFKIAMGPYKFVGKIDRLDEVDGGGTIIDYKTGGEPRGGLEKVDKDQLIIYQIAAEEFLREKIVAMQYWYLEPNKFSESFVAKAQDIEKLKNEYAATIDEIVQTIKTNTFIEADEAKSHECKYRHLE